jgi:hypothetical protein
MPSPPERVGELFFLSSCILIIFNSLFGEIDNMLLYNYLFFCPLIKQQTAWVEQEQLLRQSHSAQATSRLVL